jgi:Tol biopolymer transport system component
MVAGDTNNRMDVFVRDRQTGKTTLISRSTGGTIGNALSDAPCISPDGRYVAFESYASNFAAGDSNSKIDIYLRDRQNGTTTLISKTPGGVAGGGYSEKPALSADGRYMFFESDAPDLVVGDTNAKNDIFVRDRQTGTTILLSKS